jgi:hypothetical protein
MQGGASRLIHVACRPVVRFCFRSVGPFLSSSSSFARRRCNGLSPLRLLRSASAVAKVSGVVPLPRNRSRHALMTSRSSKFCLVESYHSLTLAFGLCQIITEVVARQHSNKLRTLALARFDMKRTAALLDQKLNHGQTYACPRASLVGRPI